MSVVRIDMKKPKFFVATIISLFITFLSALRGTVIEGGGGRGGAPCACGYVHVSFSLLGQHFGFEGLHFV